MRITPSNIYRNSFTSKVIKVHDGNLSDKLKEQIDNFEESNSKQGQKIGSGTTATAYRLPGTQYIVKVPNATNPHYKKVIMTKDEAQKLALVPQNAQHCQKCVGVCETQKGEAYLISTLMAGKPAQPSTKTKWNKNSFKNLLNEFIELEKENIYHGDPSRLNCLITERDEVNLIDFQYCEKYYFNSDYDHKTNANRYKVPYFIAPSNAQMFEETNLAKYLTELSNEEARNVFKDYLKAKSSYHRQRLDILSQKCARGEILDYEYLMSKYLENPSRELIKLSGIKLQILQAHRNINTVLDNKDYCTAIPYYIKTIKYSKMLQKEAYKAIKNTDNEEERRLYNYIRQDGRFWEDISKEELVGHDDNMGVLFYYLSLIHSENNLYQINPNISYKEITNVLGALGISYTYQEDYNTAKEKEEKLQRLAKMTSLLDTNIHKMASQTFSGYKNKNQERTLFYGFQTLNLLFSRRNEIDKELNENKFNDWQRNIAYEELNQINSCIDILDSTLSSITDGVLSSIE